MQGLCISQNIIIINNETTTQAKAHRLITFRMVSWWRWRREKDKREKTNTLNEKALNTHTYKF